MFDGKVKSIRQVSLASRNSKVDSKNTKELLENARKQREARAVDRQRNSSALLIQKIVRSKLSRLNLHSILRSTFDSLLPRAGFDNSAFQQVLTLLPGFFNRKVDLQRLLSVNKCISDILTSSEMIDGLYRELVQPERELNSVALLIRCARISVETLHQEVTSHTFTTQGFGADVEALIVFLSSLLPKEHALGTYIALQLCQYTTKGQKIVNAALRDPSYGTSTSLNNLATVLSNLIQAAVGWTAYPLVLAQIPTVLVDKFHALRKAAVVHIALNLFTQPHNPHNSTSKFAFQSVEDWLFILQHCSSTTATTSTAMRTNFPILSSVEQVNLVSHFSATVLRDPVIGKRILSVNTDSEDGHAQLGRVYLSLVANLFGLKHLSQDDSRTDTTTVSSVTPSAAFVNTLLGTVSKPSGGEDANSTSNVLQNEKESTTLPLQLMTHLSLYPSKVPSTVAPTNTASTTSTPATFATIYNSRMVEDTAMDVVTDPHQELLSDYIFASGVKKLEYRSGGLQNNIVAVERAKVSQGTDTVPSAIVNAVSSLEQLAELLSSREVVSQLASVEATHSPVGSPPSANIKETIMEIGDGSSAESAMDVDALDKDNVSESRIVLDPITTSIVHIYTQLLLSYPSEVFTTHPSTKMDATSANTTFTAAARSAVLFSLAYTNPTYPLAPRLWRYLQASFRPLLDTMVQLEDHAVLKSPAFLRACGSGSYSILPTTGSPSVTSNETTPSFLYHHLLSTLYLFMITLMTQLAAVDDEELLEQYKLFTHTELRSITQFLKKWLYKLYWTEPLFDINSSFLLTPSTTSTTYNSTTSSGAYTKLLKLHCLTVATKLFNHLCQRHERRAFLSDIDWCWPPLSVFDLSMDDKNNSSSSSSSGIGSANSNLQLKNSRVKAVLTFIPQVVPFKQRVSVLHAHLEQDKLQYYTSAATNPIQAQMGFGTGSLKVKVRRDHLVEDAYEELHTAESKLKGQVKVEFVSEQGLDEAGIDGGGLFKEFIDSFSKAAFSPSFGLFVPTSHQLLTPNPDSARTSVVKSEHLKYLNFVGKILGKAVYERILLESEFAGGFLNFLLDRKNALDDLYHLDEQVYKSLMQMKHYANKGGDVEALELYFETTRQAADGSRITYELIPGGSNVKVTRHNVHSYIHTLANYKQNVEGSEQCRAIRAGFQSMIPLEWIRMFGSSELQLLISGDQRRIDIADMKANVHYSSGYHESQPYIQAFWNIVEDMDSTDQGHLLRFVTSCSRQPLLGFGQLNPRFAIQKVPAYASQYSGLEQPLPGEAPRLPSAATCMNLFKLPQYDSVDLLREKLLYAIRSNSGFELS